MVMQRSPTGRRWQLEEWGRWHCRHCATKAPPRCRSAFSQGPASLRHWAWARPDQTAHTATWPTSSNTRRTQPAPAAPTRGTLAQARLWPPLGLWPRGPPGPHVAPCCALSTMWDALAARGDRWKVTLWILCWSLKTSQVKKRQVAFSQVKPQAWSRNCIVGNSNDKNVVVMWYVTQCCSASKIETIVTYSNWYCLLELLFAWPQWQPFKLWSAVQSS